MKFLRYCLRLLTFIFPSSWGLFSWLTLFQISVSPLWMVSLRSKNTDGYSISKWAGASLLSERNGVEKSIYVIEIALGQSGQFEHLQRRVHHPGQGNLERQIARAREKLLSLIFFHIKFLKQQQKSSCRKLKHHRLNHLQFCTSSVSKW